MTLVGIGMPQAEQDREHRHCQRGIQGNVTEDCARVRTRHSRVISTDQSVEAECYGLQLQCQVWKDADHGDDSDQCGNGLALTEAGTDEVGDRSDVVGFCDAQYLAQEREARR